MKRGWKRLPLKSDWTRRSPEARRPAARGTLGCLVALIGCQAKRAAFSRSVLLESGRKDQTFYPQPRGNVLLLHCLRLAGRPLVAPFESISSIVLTQFSRWPLNVPHNRASRANSNRNSVGQTRLAKKQDGLGAQQKEQRSNMQQSEPSVYSTSRRRVTAKTVAAPDTQSACSNDKAAQPVEEPDNARDLGSIEEGLTKISGPTFEAVHKRNVALTSIPYQPSALLEPRWTPQEFSLDSYPPKTYQVPNADASPYQIQSRTASSAGYAWPLPLNTCHWAEPGISLRQSADKLLVAIPGM